MSVPVPSNGASGGQSNTEEWVFTLTNGVVTRIERVNATSGARSELSAEEYAWVASGYYAAYYMGIGDYAHAVAAGNIEVAQAYYHGMTQYFGALGQI